MANRYDVISVGSGHNGLVAAAYLAKAGKRVLVLERHTKLGGGVFTSEIAAPGFYHDIHSAVHVLIQANPLIRSDELGLISKFGLKYVYPEAIVSTVFDDGDCIVTHTDLDKTCESIARISSSDAEAYRTFARQSATLLPLMIQGMFVPPVPQGAFWALLDQSAEGRMLMHVMQKSMLDIVNEHFQHDKVKIHLMKCAAELLIGPDEKGTGAFIFNMAGFAHTYPWGIPVGGSGALVDALVRCLKSYGAEFRTSAEVDKVLVTKGKVTGVRLPGNETITATTVIGQIHPWRLGDMVEGLDNDLVRRARDTKAAPFTLMSGLYALKNSPRFHAPQEASRVALMNYAPGTIEKYLRVFDDLKYGDFPKNLVMAIQNHAQWDPTRAPAGAGTVIATAFCSYLLRDGGADAWDARKDEFARRLKSTTGSLIENFDSDNVIGSAFLSPRDAERHSPTFQHGDVGGISKGFFQIGGHRPTPELSQYAVPGADGLYLTGTFMHPPGGVTGGGRATAVRMCDDLGIDFDRLCGGVS